MAAGSIVIDLLLKTGAFETDAKRAEKRMEALAKEAKRVGVALGTAIAGGAVAVATGLTAMVKGAIDSADAMRDLSIRTGVSTETLSAFGYAASQTGTDIDVLAKGMKVLAKNVADSLNPTSEQSKIFKALGIDVKDAQGNLRDIGDLIPEIADRFKAMEDGTTKAALAQALLGKAGLELIEFFNQGASGLAEYTDRARELGLVLDSETAAAADDFNDTLGDLKAVTQGYALALAKELLPDLQNLADSFRNTATEGNKVSEMAEGTAQFLRGLATVAHIVSSAFEIVGTGIATVVAQGQAAVKFITGDMRGALNLYKAASQGFGAEWNEAWGINQPAAKPDFSNVRGSPAQLPEVDSARIARALSNPSAGSKGKSGKSDAQKAAEDLARAYDSLIERQNEQIALHGQETEAARVRYEVEHGALTGLTAAQKELVIANAEHLDMLDQVAEHEQIAADAAREHAEEQKRLTEQRQEVLDSIRDEIDLVGMSADQQEIWNNLKWAGVDAESEWGQSIIQATRELQEQRDAMEHQIDLMDEVRGSWKGFWDDLKEGEGIVDSLENAFGRLADALFDMAVEGLSDRLFGKQGDPAGGSTGGWLGGLVSAMFGGGGTSSTSSLQWGAFTPNTGGFGSGSGASASGGGGFWSSLIGAIFGGGRAGGGDVMPRTAYLVGEQGPEMFVPRTVGMVMPAAATASMSAGRSGGPVYVDQKFIVQGRLDSRSNDQLARKQGNEARRAMTRNGGG